MPNPPAMRREASGVVFETTASPSAEVEAPTSTAPLVSIIIVTYGTGAVVLDVIAALADRTSVPVEVLVVDNPSADRPATGELLRERTSGVRLITPDSNLGFGGGNDLAVEFAAADYVCFLNPDVIVAKGWLEPLVAALDDPAVGIAGPVLLDPDGTLQEAGQLIYDDACTDAVGGPAVLSGDLSQCFSRDVDYVSAACWVVRRDEHVARGGFDDRYHPAFFEDADYALRVEAAGQRSRLVVDIPVVHHRGLGGAGRDLELGIASREVFRARWHERLADQPPRPTSDAEAMRNRDRLAVERIGLIVRGSTRSILTRALDDAASRALANPRARVTVVAGSVEGLDAGAARRAGVEVVVGDVDQLVASRRFTTLHEAGAHSHVVWDRAGRGWIIAGLAAVVAVLVATSAVRSRPGRRSLPSR